MSKIPKVFISYHHKREQKNKEKLVTLFKKHHSEYFEIKDRSVELGDINPKLEDQEIFKTIREKYLKDSDVTILILGKHTKCRKHIDWEIATSLISYGSLNRRKKNGLIILLTDDFIKKEKTNSVFDGKNYSSLITEKNSGSRIYESVENNYASVESFSKMFSNPIKLKHLIDESLNNSKRVISPNTETLLKDTILLKDTNEEECQRKYWTNLIEWFSSLFYDSKNQIFEKLAFEQIKDEINTVTKKDETIMELTFEQIKDETNEQLQSNNHRTWDLFSCLFPSISCV